MTDLTLVAINEAWWQAACLSVRATVSNVTERDNALALLALARDKANEVFNASHDRNQHATAPVSGA